MTGRLEKRIAIVTGAASGIGDAIAQRFVAEGAKVLTVDGGWTNARHFPTKAELRDHMEVQS